ncbi:hypothetical protein IQ07DRAFT_525751 [Pyrenochaeta sp. DS3sAY3a]|nr:hypothetical protein IQ07DRAFT_525751 [Pyrenochaeta sp. DS3sAY3a]
MDSGTPLLLDLPHELLIAILHNVDLAAWKHIRQTCRILDKLAAPLLFSRVYFELCGQGCESLYEISQEPTLAPLVKTVVLRRVRGYRKFSSFDSWTASTHQPGAPDDGLWSACETTYHNNKALCDQLMPYNQWIAMPAEDKEALYEAYNADREQLQMEIASITNTLCFRAAEKLEFIHPDRAIATGKAIVAVRQLNKALKALPNLSALEHEPSFWYDNWALRWRDLYFHPFSILGQTYYDEDEDVEALQISVVLQSLAYFRVGDDHRLKKMSIHVGGPAFATPGRLRHLWSGMGHEITRLCRELHPASSAAAADAEANDNFATPAEIERYGRELYLMRLAFADLTHLDFSMSEDDEREGCIAIAATLAFLFLSTTKNLRELNLAIGNLVYGDLMPVFGVDEKQCATGSILLLQHIAHRAPWRHIRNIQLEIATDRTTLVTFLLAHKNTLRLLTLTQTSLVRLENPQNTWEFTLTEIGKGLCLESLTLAKLTDVLVDWSPGVQPRMLFDKDDKRWQDRLSDYETYYQDCIHRILRGEEIYTLDPLPHLLLHTPPA